MIFGFRKIKFDKNKKVLLKYSLNFKNFSMGDKSIDASSQAVLQRTAADCVAETEVRVALNTVSSNAYVLPAAINLDWQNF